MVYIIFWDIKNEFEQLKFVEIKSNPALNIVTGHVLDGSYNQSTILDSQSITHSPNILFATKYQPIAVHKA